GVEMTVDSRLVSQVVQRTIDICEIPGPPLDEAARGDVVQNWWSADGLDGVVRDSVGNVWACVSAGTPGTDAIVVCAHLDTVFAPDQPHGTRREGNRLCGPGVGDDSIALASLATLATTLPATTHPVWILATIGEEGLGDLAGIRGALAEPVVPIGAVIAVEGNYLGRVCATGVGSVRWRVTVEGPGGHSWEARHAPSAVHVAARMVDLVARLPLPSAGTSAVNIGTISGGESINSRARHCSFDVDLRSDDPASLESLRLGCEQIFTSDPQGCSVDHERIGDRPAGRIDQRHPLAMAAVWAQQQVGVEPEFVAASTDANAAHAAGLPALAVGITVGGDEHTLREWIELDPIESGLRALALTVSRFDATR
ncbi:MAG: M20/M25/M40 family metallo-hydrolase, partial [Ilumatobacteraceae bacterium]